MALVNEPKKGIYCDMLTDVIDRMVEKTASDEEYKKLIDKAKYRL